jgi:GntR family transcriptional regulator
MPRSPIPVVLVNWNSDEPVYAQIARQIRACIASGGLPAGSELPPVRTVASDLGVNLNTVARAYRILAEERFVRIRDRSGATVASPARAVDASAVERMGEELAVVIARMRQAGVGIEELRRRVERELAGLESRGAK